MVLLCVPEVILSEIQEMVTLALLGYDDRLVDRLSLLEPGKRSITHGEVGLEGVLVERREVKRRLRGNRRVRLRVVRHKGLLL